MRVFFRQPVDDALSALEPIVRVRSPWRSLVPMLLALVATWIIYVPIHELLHAFGCMVTGGQVWELQIKRLYGGAILAHWFDFVKPGGQYAGRLSGFETFGSDWIYLATDFMPFVLTVLVGVSLIRWCTRRRRPWLFGAAVVLGFAPFYNLPGDYYEMGSIMTTRALTFLAGGGYPPAYVGVRSDDVFTLIGNLFVQPMELGLQGPGQVVVGSALILVSMVVALLLAFVTYALGSGVARVLVGPAQPLSFKGEVG